MVQAGLVSSRGGNEPSEEVSNQEVTDERH